MKNFRQKLMSFMYGRYGVDELCYALVILGMVFTFTARAVAYTHRTLPTKRIG